MKTLRTLLLPALALSMSAFAQVKHTSGVHRSGAHAPIHS